MGLIPGLAQWVKDLALLWLWRRLAATALIQPLAWERPCAPGVALKDSEKKQKIKKTTKKTKNIWASSHCGKVVNESN